MKPILIMTNVKKTLSLWNRVHMHCFSSYNMAKMSTILFEGRERSGTPFLSPITYDCCRNRVFHSPFVTTL
ncbi:hypothetical protein EMIT079MI2_410008 [Bacillus sp. IT-79MI2]